LMSAQTGTAKGEQPGRPPPGLDEQKHARAQRAAAKAEVVRDGLISSYLAAALGTGGQFDPHDFRAYLDRLLADAKVGADPIQRVLVEQLGFAHLRLAKLHAEAAAAKSLEAHKVLNAACSRLLGEVQRTALTLEALKGKAPQGSHLKVAQTG
ncbi:MAG: hypothetical protein J2P46_15995, partial [Zavarzinella sp.]|nr:hypothetical protein [Zavarzinella sp.]